MSKTLIKAVQNTFQTQFKTKPLLIFSPGRINLIGEHTDYNDGFVFPAAIDKGIALAIAKSTAKISKIYAADNDESYEFETTSTLVPLKNGGWVNYIIGVVAELKNAGYTLANFNAVFSGNIPAGAGMSSSAALENSFVFGLNTLFNLGLSKTEMILISQKAEHHFAGVKCGIMDQYASMFGIKNSALLLDCRTLTAKPYHIEFKDYELLLINTNVKHELSESAYNERRSVCEKVSKLLGVKALRDASKTDLDAVKSKISEQDYQKALYVINENLRVQQFSKAIESHDLKTLGSLLYQSHEGLSKNYKVSCDELDFLVNEAKANPDVLGARMMGGGFGGCTINLINKNAVETFKKDVSKVFKTQFKNDCSLYSVELSQGTHLIDL